MHLRNLFTTRAGFINLLHIVILVLSVFLVVSISVDTFADPQLFTRRSFLTLQMWICIVFLAVFFIELAMSVDWKRFVGSHIFFFIVSIPYLSIIDALGLHFSGEVEYLLRFVPLIRGGYALAIVVGWFTSDRTVSVFITYLLVMLSTVYFCSLVFYVCEHNVNPGVEDFGDAIWWASMDTTTVGSSIEAVTPVGRILAVVLACMGMMMLPMFTVYLTSLLKRRPAASFFTPRNGSDKTNGASSSR